MTTLSILQCSAFRALTNCAHSSLVAIHRVFVTVALLLEPAIRTVCTFAMLLGVSTAVVFESSAVGPIFPFMTMLASSLGIGLVLIAYYALLGCLVD